MTFKLMNDLEKKGILDVKVAGHKLARPAGVMRGDEPDRLSLFLFHCQNLFEFVPLPPAPLP